MFSIISSLQFFVFRIYKKKEEKNEIEARE